MKLDELIASGLKSTEIAVILNCSTKTVLRKANKLGLNEDLRRNTVNWKRQRNLKTCILLLNKNASLEQIANEIGITVANTQSYVAEAVNNLGAPWNVKCERCGNKITHFIGAGRFCTIQCSRSYASLEQQIERAPTQNLKKEIKTRQPKTKLSTPKRTPEEQSEAKSKSLKSFWASNPEAKERLAEYRRGIPMTPEARAKLSISARAATLRTIEEGRHIGWKSRKIVSYPERFWMELLDNAEIKYSHNYPVGRKTLELNGAGAVFLDFFIEGAHGELIDLEIDGKQHLYPERIASDQRRDEALINAGYLVYRAPWVNPRTKGEELHQIILLVECFLSVQLKRKVELSSQAQ